MTSLYFLGGLKVEKYIKMEEYFYFVGSLYFTLKIIFMLFQRKIEQKSESTVLDFAGGMFGTGEENNPFEMFANILGALNGGDRNTDQQHGQIS